MTTNDVTILYLISFNVLAPHLDIFSYEVFYHGQVISEISVKKMRGIPTGDFLSNKS